MKHIKLLVVLFLIMPLLQYAQSNNEIVKEVQKLLLKNYIILDKAKETNIHLDTLIKENYFDKFKDPNEFAKALSKEMQKITKDRHLNVAPPRPPRPRRTSSEFVQRHLRNMVQFRSRGFGELNLFEGNVAYVNLIGFRREDLSKVDDIMSLFSTADAIIIDLRENGGGSVLGEYWSSYFFKEGTHLNSRHTRVTNKTVDYKTEKVKGRKRLEMPIFILTSNFTFSAAEAFAYDLQSRKRATIIGESTGGGAHPVNFIRLPKGFGLIVPDSESLNPITKTNWEGTGVIPDVKTSKGEALNKGKELAKIAAKKYRETPFNTLKVIFDKKKISTADENKINELFSLLLERKHLEDFMINNMGYSYLDTDNIIAALAIFKSNLKFFPNSPNAHDSYAEALAKNNQKKLALKHYKMAVALARKTSDRSLNYFVDTLEKFKKENNFD